MTKGLNKAEDRDLSFLGGFAGLGGRVAEAGGFGS
jgi:hypothetical protein